MKSWNNCQISSFCRCGHCYCYCYYCCFSCTSRYDRTISGANWFTEKMTAIRSIDIFLVSLLHFDLCGVCAWACAHRTLHCVQIWCTNNVRNCTAPYLNKHKNLNKLFISVYGYLSIESLNNLRCHLTSWGVVMLWSHFLRSFILIWNAFVYTRVYQLAVHAAHSSNTSSVCGIRMNVCVCVHYCNIFICLFFFRSVFSCSLGYRIS